MTRRGGPRGLVIGVTGSFGTGKSTVAELLRRRGAHRLDADVMAHALMAPGRPVWRRLRRRFGPGILRPDRQVDRRALGCAGFRSRAAWRALCGIVHPAVIAETRRALRGIRRRDPSAVVVLDVPLLYESGMDVLADVVMVVTAPWRRQVARGRGRWPVAELRRRLRWQWPLARKAQRADVVIDNGGSRQATADQVARWWDGTHEERHQCLTNRERAP